MKTKSRFTLGIILIVVGIVFLITEIGIFDIYLPIGTIINTFWPLILIFFGARLLSDGNNGGGIVLLVLGVTFLSSTLFHWSFFSVLWPLIIITIGAFILVNSNDWNRKARSTSKARGSDSINERIMFWGTEKKVDSSSFTGGNIDVFLGGTQIDLRDVKVAKDGANLNINVVLGQVELYVPKDCRVVSDGTQTLGEWSVSVEKRDIKEPILTITGNILLGSVNIK